MTESTAADTIKAALLKAQYASEKEWDAKELTEAILTASYKGGVTVRMEREERTVEIDGWKGVPVKVTVGDTALEFSSEEQRAVSRQFRTLLDHVGRRSSFKDPYGGEGTLQLGDDAQQVFTVKLGNTEEGCFLELTPAVRAAGASPTAAAAVAQYRVGGESRNRE